MSVHLVSRIIQFSDILSLREMPKENFKRRKNISESTELNKLSTFFSKTI